MGQQQRTVIVLLARRKPFCISDPPTPAHTVIQKTSVNILGTKVYNTQG